MFGRDSIDLFLFLIHRECAFIANTFLHESFRDFQAYTRRCYFEKKKKISVCHFSKNDQITLFLLFNLGTLKSIIFNYNIKKPVTISTDIDRLT